MKNSTPIRERRIFRWGRHRTSFLMVGLAGLLTASVLTGCSSASATADAASSTSPPTVTASAPPTRAPGLYVTVEPSVTSAKIGQPIPVTLHLDNTSGHAIQVDQGMCQGWFSVGLVNAGHPKFPGEEGAIFLVNCGPATIVRGQTSRTTTIVTDTTDMIGDQSYTPGVYNTLAVKGEGAIIHEPNVVFSSPVSITLHD